MVLPQYNYYTNNSFIPPKHNNAGHWKKEHVTEFTTQQKHKYVYQEDCLDYKPTLEYN